MDTYKEIQQEVLAEANSDEGYLRLIEGLIWQEAVENPRIAQLRTALTSYVYAKRCRELEFKKGITRAWHRRPYGSLNVEAERENAQAIEKKLALEIGIDEVRALKKQIGSSLQGLLKRQTL